MPHPFSWRWWLTASILLLGSAGVTVAWVAVAVLDGGSVGWMALVAAADAWALLRLTGAPAGWPSSLSAFAATVLAIAASQWLLAATRVGLQLGLDPIASATRLGPHLAWALARMNLDLPDLACLVLALVLAIGFGHGLPRRRAEPGA